MPQDRKTKGTGNGSNGYIYPSAGTIGNMEGGKVDAITAKEQ